VKELRTDEQVEVFLTGFADLTPRARAELAKMAEEHVSQLVGIAREDRKEVGAEDIENAVAQLRLRGPRRPKQPSRLSIGLRTGSFLIGTACAVCGGFVPGGAVWALPLCVALWVLAGVLTIWDLTAVRRNE